MFIRPVSPRQAGGRPPPPAARWPARRRSGRRRSAARGRTSSGRAVALPRRARAGRPRRPCAGRAGRAGVNRPRRSYRDLSGGGCPASSELSGDGDRARGRREPGSRPRCRSAAGPRVPAANGWSWARGRRAARAPRAPGSGTWRRTWRRHLHWPATRCRMKNGRTGGLLSKKRARQREDRF